MSLLVSVSLWFVATTIYFILANATSLDRVWLTFIYTIPINCIVLIVFSAVWFKKIHVYIFTSLLVWSVFASIYISINQSSLWFIFILALIAQGIIFFAIPLKRKKI